MIINNARGSHSSPGVYTKEVDVIYSVKSLGITSLGLAGETLKGPAFEPIKIEKWSEFVDYFGSTSSEKFKGTGYPKYELPYIAKEYLKESKQLYVCRALGLSGYGNEPVATTEYTKVNTAWVVYASAGQKNYPVAVLRSRGSYNGDEGDCMVNSGDTISYDVTGVSFGNYSPVKYDANCTQVSSGQVDSNAAIVTEDNLGKFTLTVSTKSGSSVKYPVSLNYGDSDYIYNVFGTSPFAKSSPLFVEYVYDYALRKLREDTPSATTIQIAGVSAVTNISDYREAFRCAVTPWIVSQVNAATSGNTSVATAQKLFRVYTLSDGDSANNEIKISIEKIRPNEGTFDLVVRAMNDSDAYPVVLEKFTGCNFIPKDKNYLPMRVGSYDGVYELKSKYIAIEMNEGADVVGAVPCGFLGYPLHKIGTMEPLPVCYNTDYNYALKAKRQYFGFSNLSGIDVDTFTYKGVNHEDSGVSSTHVMSHGFHLDSILGVGNFGNKVNVDGDEYILDSVSPYTAKAKQTKIPRIVTEQYNEGTIYEDINARKFTVCFYGGFDGWDIYRMSRTNTDNFKALRYNGETYKEMNIDPDGQNMVRQEFNYLDLPSNAITSDYYAYLAAYRQFANPEAIDINVFATPGIDWLNNELLVEDALDVIEDSDDGRGGDALYIVTTPNKPTGATDSFEDMYAPMDIVENLANTSIDTSYAATYWPWVKYFDKDENVYINLPVTKDVVRNLAYVDNTSFPWFAPAGINRGDVNCVRACKKTRLADEDTLYDGNINPVKTFAADGVKIWGNKTMYTVDSPLNRVNVRRLMIRIKKLITGVGKNLIFDQYDNSLKNQFLSLVTPILSSVKTNRGIYDYRIDIDDSVEARDAHTLPCTIHVKPTPTLEYIDLTFTIYPESVDFRD